MGKTISISLLFLVMYSFNASSQSDNLDNPTLEIQRLIEENEALKSNIEKLNQLLEQHHGQQEDIKSAAAHHAKQTNQVIEELQRELSQCESLLDRCKVALLKLKQGKKEDE